MIRATITVSFSQQLKTVYELLDKIPDLTIVRLKNKLNVGLQNVTLNIEYNQSIIGEI